MADFDVVAKISADVSGFKRGMAEVKASMQGFATGSSSTFSGFGDSLSGAKAAMQGFATDAGAAFTGFSDKLNSASNTLSNVASNFSNAGKIMSAAFTVPIVGAGAAAFNMAADLEDAMGASDQIFGGSSNTVKSWAGSLETYYGIAGGEALTYGNTMGAMLKNIGGLTEEEAASTTGTLVELAGDLTAMYGGSTSSAVQALTGALKGNNSMLDNYGMGVNEATIKTRALEMGLVAEGEEMTLAAKQAATLNLIMEQTADAQGQAAREAEGASGSMRTMLTELKNLGAEIGGVLLPVITPMIQKLTEAVTAFKGLSAEQQSNILKWVALIAAIGPALLIIGGIAKVAAVVVGVFSAISAAVGAFMTVIGGGGTAIAALKAGFAALMGPVGWVTVAIVALIAAGIWLWQNWDIVKAKATELGAKIAEVWNAILTWTTTTWTAIGAWLIAAWNTIKASATTTWEAIKTAITTAMDNIKTGIKTGFDNAKTAVSTAMDNIKTAIKNGFADAVTAVKTACTDIVSAVKTGFQNAISAAKNFASDAINVGRDLITGFINGVKAKASALVESVKGAIGNAIDAAKNLLKIGSPSKLFNQFGRWTDEGFAIGIDKGAKEPIKAMSAMAAGVAGVWQQDMSGLSTKVDGMIGRSIQTDVKMTNDYTKQPAYINLDLGGRSYRAFVEDISNAQSQNVRFEESYSL